MKNDQKESEKKEKIAVLFPGIGYTCDKPLLYYSWKLAASLGYRVLPVNYGGFPKNAKGNAEKMAECFRIAFEQTEEILKQTDWDEYGDIVLVGKSIGTAVAARYAQSHGLAARGILFTPLEFTFPFSAGSAIAFHGTADPWAKDQPIEDACRRESIPLFITEKANHSLETGEIAFDIENLGRVMAEVSAFLERR